MSICQTERVEALDRAANRRQGMSTCRARIGRQWVIPLSRGRRGILGRPVPLARLQAGRSLRERSGRAVAPDCGARTGRRHVGQRQSRRRGSWSRRGDGRPERDPGLLPAPASRAGLSPPPAAGTGPAPLGAWAEGRLAQRGLWENAVSPHPHAVAMVTRSAPPPLAPLPRQPSRRRRCGARARACPAAGPRTHERNGPRAPRLRAGPCAAPRVGMGSGSCPARSPVLVSGTRCGLELTSLTSQRCWQPRLSQCDVLYTSLQH